jgi:hypothetical protein
MTASENALAKRRDAEQALDKEKARGGPLIDFLHQQSEELASCNARLDRQTSIVDECVAKAIQRIGERRGTAMP